MEGGNKKGCVQNLNTSPFSKPKYEKLSNYKN